MKLVIAGSRDINVNSSFVIGSLVAHDIKDIEEVIEGGCPTGADSAAAEYVRIHNELMQGAGMYDGHAPLMKHTQVKADWDKHGKAAGPIRNKEMAELGDALLLIWDGKSRGSTSMKKCMEELNKPVYEVIIK
jgi:hypothetical protein